MWAGWAGGQGEARHVRVVGGGCDCRSPSMAGRVLREGGGWYQIIGSFPWAEGEHRRRVQHKVQHAAGATGEEHLAVKLAANKGVQRTYMAASAQTSQGPRERERKEVG